MNKLFNRLDNVYTTGLNRLCILKTSIDKYPGEWAHKRYVDIVT